MFSEIFNSILRVYRNTIVEDALENEEGMTTIEYALGCLAAAAFAAVLYAVVKGGAVRDALEGLITNALNTGL